MQYPRSKGDANEKVARSVKYVQCQTTSHASLISHGTTVQLFVDNRGHVHPQRHIKACQAVHEWNKEHEHKLCVQKGMYAF